MKKKTKAQSMWEVGKEQEKWFKDKCIGSIKGYKYIEEQFDELMKLIRGSEYRRGKEEGIKELRKELSEKSWFNQVPDIRSLLEEQE